MKLIEDWRQAWRFHTVIAAAALGVFDWVCSNFDVLEQLLSPATVTQLAAVLPPDRVITINKWAALVLIVLRLVRQKTPAPAAAAPADPVTPKESP
jgi:hypothetical protein